jgi:hypothetical protein
VLLLIPGVAQCRQSIGGFPGLRDEQREIAGFERCLAVPEFGGDVDVDRQPRKALEPVLPDQACVICRPRSVD